MNAWLNVSLGALISIVIALPVSAELPVPCGSCAGGVWVSSGNASLNNIANGIEVHQTTPQAILNWQSFNVGAGKRVDFNQPSSTAVALNRIFQSDPSKIFGSVTANGQIYLINQNGIVFGAGAEVNTQSIIASTLDVPDDVFTDIGLVNAVNENRAALEGAGSDEQIIVENGAEIRVAQDGRVLLAAPEVINRGRILADEGQTLLVGAKDKVYLEASDDDTLRGLLVEVQTGGSVSNLGEIISDGGNTTLLGLAVNQSGRVQANSTLTKNGTIRLLARDDAVTVAGSSATDRTLQARRSGELVLASGSETIITPDASDAATASDAQGVTASRIEMMADDILIKTGASVVATGGEIEIAATKNPQAPFTALSENDASIIIESGADISVSGADNAQVSAERNFVEVELRGNELRDNPVNRDGPVRGTTVVVDSRYGTEFADISAFLDATERNVSERLSTGGSIDIKSEGSIELQQGASLSAKGGVIEYLPGRDTSSFLIKDGALTNIRDADPTVRYDGVFGDVERDYQKWSVTEYFQIFGPADSAWSIGAQVPGYVEGTDAGTISLIAPSINLAGNLDLSVTPGTLQRLAPTSAAGDFRPFNELPLGGLLTLGGELGVAGDFGIQKIVFGQDAGDDDTLFLDPNMFLNGTVPRLNLSATESITIPADMHITLAPAGALSLTSGNVIVDGQVTIPAGDISFNTKSTFSVAEGNLRLGNGALLDVSGNWVNDPESVAAGSGFAPLYVDGGSVNLTSNGDLRIPAGSEIRAWGGGQIDESGAINPGRGGHIDIDVAALERRLQLDGNLSAFALENGGSLNISAAGFSFGVEQGPTSPFVALDSHLLNGAGFASISLISRISGLDIAANTALEVTQQNLLLTGDFGRAESGTNIADITDIGLLPDQNRNSTSLNLVYENGGLGQPTATVSLGRGASITADLGSDISLVADTRVLIDGSIEAPGGNVTARVARPGDEIGFDANQKIWLGDKANINVDGRALSIINSDTGLRDVQLIDAGSISLEAQRGYVIGHPNASLSANAASTLIDVASMSNNGLASTITQVEAYTNAGTISLSSPEGIFYGGSLAAMAADVAGSEAGTLSFTLDSAIREAGDLASLGLPLFPITNDQMVISETRAIPFFGADELVPNSANGLAVIRPAMLNNGFDNVVLTAKSEGNAAGLIAASSLVFDHATDLAVANSLVIDASEISVLAGHVQINAGQLSLGPIEQDYRYLPTSALGTGRFTANAGSVRIIGDLFFENLAPTNALSIEAESHLQLLGNSQNADRTNLLGSIRSVSDIKLTAPVIYPGTFTDFQIKNDRVDGAITIARRGNLQASIFSVAGQLTLEADNISQGGYLNAPFGQINLTGETVNLLTDSVTSVAAENTVLFGETQFSRDWIYPLFGDTLLIDGAPEKSISIDADSVNLEPGSTIDVSGGGDLLAVEFVPGPGGSIDITANDGNSDGSFAIIPSYGAQSLPWDPLISPGAGIELGDVIVLSQNDVIPAGSYAVLPARFSLLPAAFLLTPNSSDPLLVPGSTNLDGAGRSLVVGKRGAATTGFTDSLWTDFVVSDGAAIRNRAQYAESLANTFFAASATRPLDNGNLSLAATTALNLQGTVLSDPNGRAPAIDIVASKINIVNDRADAAADAVAILAHQLSSFSSGSVLLGATRSSGSSTTTLNVLSDEINIGANTKLSGSEFILAAKDNIVVGANATIEAAGEGNDSSLDSISIDGDAALLIVSQGRRNLQRTGTIGAAGSLTTEAGSLISASGQVLIDVTGNADLSGGLVSNGGEIALGAPRISIGDAPGGTTGTVLSGSLLSQLGTANVSFRSASTFDIFASSDLTFGNLSIDAEAIVGHLGAGESLNINADALTLSNQGSARGATRADGELRFTSTTTTFGAGTTSFDNLDKVTIAATDGMLWVGDNDVLVGGDINLAAPFFANQTSGASLNIETQSGAIDVSRLGTDVAVDDDALGGELSLRGLEINFNADALLPSGIFTAIASAGNVNLSNANIDVSGRSIDFVESLLITPGGRITVDGINIDLSSATLEAGAPGRQGGSVELLASGGINLNAASLGANGGGGSLFIDAVTLSGADTGQAIQGFNAGGFDNQLRISLDAQDINLGLNTSLTGQLISLVSDTGNVSLLGSINASGGKAGKIRAYAGNTLTLGSDATLIATASDADEIGGRVELGANGDVIVGATNIAVDAGAGGRAGSVLIRAPTVANDIAVSQFDATVTGVDFVEFEAVQTFNGASLANANALIKPSLDTFAGNIGTIEARLDSASLPGVRVSLGAEVIDSGNLTIGNLDLINWRFGGNPGTLTIRTAGDITFDGTLGDGFVPEPFAVANGLAARDSAIFGESSSFRITSGADTTSADPMALNRALTSGVTFNNGGTLRTGTGDIELATTGDLIFLDDYAIYSAGENRGAGVYGDVNREVLLHGDFLENGGDVSLEVGGNLTAENQSGVVTDWLARGALEIVAGSVGINVPDIGTSWAVAFSHFNQGIGAFAGGDIDITVRGAMLGTSVYLPSSALPTGNIGSEPDIVGGGDLTLMTFGDLSGGSFHVGSGQAKISVGGNLSGGMSNPLILSVSDGVYDITSRGDISFDGLVDPFLLPRSELQGLPRPGTTTPFQSPSYNSFFASFAEDTAINFKSISGSINLIQNLEAFEILSPFVDFTSADVSAFSITPPTLTAASLSQSVLVEDTFSLYPSSLGTVELFAKNNVAQAGTEISLINLSDANLDFLPSIANPLESLALTRQLVLNTNAHGFEAVREGNGEPTRIVALDGFVGSDGNSDLILKLGKRTRIYGGSEIRRLQLEAQHVNPDDVSVVYSAGDIIYPLARSTSNALADSQVSNLTFAGPGRADVIAAGTIDLGTSGGIRSIGDSSNPVLEDAGATLNVLAGIGDSPDYVAFAQEFLAPDTANHNRLIAYLKTLGVPVGTDPVASYAGLTETQQRQLAIDVFFDELVDSGVFATSSGTDDYSRGNEAIATLFPGDNYNGDLISLVSRIQTVDGGDINILVPGGDIIAGTSSVAASNPAADRIGIVVQREGDLNIFLRDDLLVEISRVFTLDGGDISIWSAEGDIDAGRGAKSALSIPGLITTFDAEGNIVTEFPPSIQGSGIRAAVATPGRSPGDVFLFAPQGAVIAGDAGIGSAGNLTIGATEVVGADNIDVGGVSVGVPAADVGSVAAGLTGASDSSASAAKSAQDSTGDSLASSEEAIGEALAQGALSFISVEVLGFGG